MAERTIEQDLELARDVVAGSLPAWHAFIDDYANLINAVVSRVLKDRDEAATVFVDVLDRMYRGKLRQYRGDARLSTWLAVVARSAALDHLRGRHGRHGLPAAIRGLGDLDQAVFRLRFVEGLDRVELRAELRRRGHRLSAAALDAAIDRVDAGLGPRSRRRLDWELHARAVGAESGRFLECLEHQRREAERRRGRSSPEALLLEKEARETVAKIRAVIATIPAREREVLSLRFEQGLKARAIAERMDLTGARQAFTLIDRALRRVRRAVSACLD
jgi:RNA polymerase sigma factor (sigma-70 family)